MKAEAPKDVEQVKLSEAAVHLLNECRMVLPGIQAIFGFQLIAVFNERFSRDLESVDQRVHLASLTFVAIAAAIIMMPAAYHRMAGVTRVSRRFLEVSSTWLIASLMLLAVGLSLDYYVIWMLVLGERSVAIAGAAMLAVLTWLWLVEPRRQAAKDRGESRRPEPARVA